MGRQTLNSLAKEFGLSRKRIQRYFSSLPYCNPSLVNLKSPLVLVADATFWGRGYGVIVFRAPDLKRNLWWTEIRTETADSYHQGRQLLLDHNIRPSAVVIDGKPGIAEVFQDVPVQICHFHQIAIVRRYVTKWSKLPAAQQLLSLAETLPNTNENTFQTELAAWYDRWRQFLSQRTFNPDTGRSHFTHKRLRSAYHSLQRHLKYLFTYQRFTELGIPNTTNSLESTFGYLKHLLEVHRGIARPLRYKFICNILTKNSN